MTWLCTSEPSTTTTLLIVYILIAAVHCYLLYVHYMYYIHSYTSLQLPSGAEYDVPSVTTPTPKVMDTAMYSEVFQSQKVHVYLSGTITISMLVNTVLGACHQIVP